MFSFYLGITKLLFVDNNCLIFMQRTSKKAVSPKVFCGSFTVGRTHCMAKAKVQLDFDNFLQLLFIF